MTDSAIETVTIADGEPGGRLDRVLAARIPALSRSRLKALILAGQVAIAARTVRDPAAQVNSGDTVTVTLPEAEPAKPAAEEIPLDIVYEDDALIVIDKPKGLVVHPAAGHATGTLVNALIAHCGDSLSGIGGVKRPGIVHRLDKDTTGLMVVAKTDKAHRALSKQFEKKLEGPLERGYLAFVWGAPDRPRGTVDAPLDRHPHAREKRAVRAGGRDAVTHWELVERFSGEDSSKDGGKPVAALLACTLETGRTHQIRVHLAHIGHPILGDETYATGFKTRANRLTPAAREALASLGRQALHAYRLAFEHPVTGEFLEFESELPADLAALEAALKA
ncbi:RluA family pseudouridine synthase [Pseudolabrys taiwanensis]|uniref:Pseudouridine synthase n=1 Tax=Pseudolabrys taiwanensis TaxID=331696 RepID=A0A345ZWF3_9HYPH|nr:RluA family pseudouridine synthase [Pseudolabrys taiwanensis]AXK81250.1 RluA family pseudouridine synthase [Pseudolabrys taiwanensis]